MSETETLTAARTPTVYFIDDSATMREVIKIAFRKENIHVITCPDARSALAQFSETAPDAVITDVIMPDQDGYEVCEFIKRHEQFGRTPVILMSGVVNKTVAERAMAVKADELVRKPFQPQELIARVKNLLSPRRSPGSGPDPDSSAASRPAHALTSLFAPVPPASAAPLARPNVAAQAVTTRPVAPAAASPAEVQRLRTEVLRLELLVKKLQASLDAEKEYCTALEAHLKGLERP
ncbi:MAG TPA: response regulator [Candidatus Acidoferrum sp.]|nr:response regulator [Candidatus Acidoferrum sp.]